MTSTASSMQYRRFGKTGISMPVFSCGGMRYQDGWKDKPIEEIDPEIQDKLEATIDASLERGINHIETARGYGPSERQLGQYLPKLDRKSFILQTKNGVREDPVEFRTQILDSLDRLQMDYVDLFAIHGINNEKKFHLSTRPGGLFSVAQQLRREGKIRHIGFSTHGGIEVLRKTVAFRDPETGAGFDYINLHWYYVYQELWPVIQDAYANDMGVFIISPTDKGGMLQKPTERLLELCSPLHPITFNDLYCLSKNEVHTLSVGADKPSDFEEHMNVLPLLENPSRHLSPILRKLENRYDEVIEPELRDPFGLGLPPLEEIPGNINVSRILQLRNLAKAYDLLEFGRGRYNLIGNIEDWFPGQNASPENIEKVRSRLKKLFGTLPVGQLLMSAIEEAHDLLYEAPKKRQSES